MNIVAVVLLSAQYSNAQNLDDALRYSDNRMGYVSARAGAIGSAFKGISDDMNAVIVNPAGLSLLKFNELSVSLSMNRAVNESKFFSLVQQAKENSVNLQNIGFASPVKLGKYGGGFGITYTRLADFTSTQYINAFNPLSSLTNNIAGSSNTEDNLAYQVALADIIGGRMFTPFKDSVQQTATTRISGGLNNISVGGSINVSEDLSIGLSVGSTYGTYSYLRDFTETDRLGKYNSLDRVNFTNVDARSVTYTDSLEQTVSSLTAKLGVIAKVSTWGRLSFTVGIPSELTVSENFLRRAEAVFDNGDVRNGSEEPGLNGYSISTPWEFGFGASIHIAGLTVASNVDYRDQTKLKFNGTLSQFGLLNRLIPQQMTEQLTWGFGAEYMLPLLPLTARAGITHTSSPFTQALQQLGINRSTAYSLGAGYNASKDIRLDGMVRFISLSRTYSNYGDGSTSSYFDTYFPTTYAVQLTYRF
jgi:hypothetical protein